MDQHTGGKWFIYGTERHKDDQLQGLESQALWQFVLLVFGVVGKPLASYISVIFWLIYSKYFGL